MTDAVKLAIRNFSLFYGAARALRGITLDVLANQILGIIGPAGSGKTALLRAMNRLNDLNPNCRVEGQILLDGEAIYQPDFDAVRLRKRVGMVFALPVPLPLSLFDNIVYGPRLSGIRSRTRLNDLVERSLQAAFLWDEVKDRLHTSAMRLSGGQQQRLCLARVLAMEPEVILLDEPCSGLDPISSARIEEALIALKSKYTIAFLLQGDLVEIGPTGLIFTAPKDQRTNNYVSGRFG